MRAGLLLCATALVVAGCGAAEERADPVVQAAASIPLVGTEWQLVGMHQAGVTVPTRPNLDVTFTVQPDGRFQSKACNNVSGQVVLGASTAMFDGGSATDWVCPGAAAEVDGALRSTLHGAVNWVIEGRTLRMDNAEHDVRLEFRVKDQAQPPTSAVTVASLEGSAPGCRIMVGTTDSGERLYALGQLRAGGPWRLVRSGPAAPGDAPLLAPELLDRSTGRTCTAGFAPASATRVAFQAGAEGPETELTLHRMAGIASPIYVGVIAPSTSAEPGRVRAYDADGRVLALWFTLP